MPDVLVLEMPGSKDAKPYNKIHLHYPPHVLCWSSHPSIRQLNIIPGRYRTSAAVVTTHAGAARRSYLSGCAETATRGPARDLTEGVVKPTTTSPCMSAGPLRLRLRHLCGNSLFLVIVAHARTRPLQVLQSYRRVCPANPQIFIYTYEHAQTAPVAMQAQAVTHAMSACADKARSDSMREPGTPRPL